MDGVWGEERSFLSLPPNTVQLYSIFYVINRSSIFVVRLHFYFYLTLHLELDALVEQMMSKTFNHGQTEFVCNVCKKVMKKKRHMMCHVETHIEGVTHVCNICNKTFKTRNSLDKHRHTYHKGEQHFGDNSLNVDQSYAY